MKQYEAAEEKRIKEEKRKFNGMRWTEADKKLRSTFESKCVSQHSSNDQIFSKFKELFNRVGKISNDHKVTHFHSPFKLVKVKGRRVPLHLLAGENEELKRMETEGRMIKLEKCVEDCLMSSIVITRKKDGSINLALDSKFLNDHIFKNKYQNPNIHELIDNVARQISKIQKKSLVQQLRSEKRLQST